MNQALTEREGETLFSLQNMPKLMPKFGGAASVSVIGKIMGGSKKNRASAAAARAASRDHSVESDSDEEQGSNETERRYGVHVISQLIKGTIL
jgi:hypothetical protein